MALNSDGAGVIRSGKTAFVPGSLPGELVRFVRVRSSRSYDDAELIDVRVAAANRVTPRCAHFGICGGCSLQHLQAAAQLATKQLELGEALQRIGGVAPQRWLAPLAGPIWNYRRRARLGVRFVTKKARVLVGFRERLKPYIAEMQRCEILAAPLDGLIEPLAELIGCLSRPTDLPQIEVAVAQEAVALVLRIMSPLSEADVELLRGFERKHALHFYTQTGNYTTVRPLSEPAPRLHYSLPDFSIELDFQPTDFIQVNAALNRSLVARAVELLELDATSRVLDLFCGLGNFTLAMARRAGEVVGVEGDAGLVERARANARRNGLDNASFHVANLAEERAEMPPWLARPFSHVLLDPPRAGAKEMLPLLAKLAPERLLYVSCHPGTLARDVGILVAQYAYKLVAAGVVDMFPHTTHVESIALLEPA